MPRTARLSASFLYYHIVNRGINRQAIFRKKADYLRFLEKLFDSKKRFDWIIYSYSLLPNHFHLQVKTRKDPLAKILSSLLTSHSVYFNRKYKRTGAVFQNRFKSIIIQKEPYHLQLSKYIHLNPVKCKLAVNPVDYPYSSYSEYLGKPKHQFHIIDKRVMKSIMGIPTKKTIQHYCSFVEEKGNLEYDPQLTVRGIVGSKRFAARFG